MGKSHYFFNDGWREMEPRRGWARISGWSLSGSHARDVQPQPQISGDALRALPPLAA